VALSNKRSVNSNTISEKAQKRRIQVDLSQSSFERLERLKHQMEAASFTEVTKESYKLLEFLVGEAKQGKRFFVQEAGGKLQELRIFSIHR
jgi:hypothetical protein